MFDAIGTVLAWLYELTHNYGLAIMLLTLAIMVVLTPLTLKGTRSMIAMQRLQPEMKKIQNRYKDDRQKLNEEMMKFYKENSINPVGGCLPLILQMPVFFVLYRVLYGLTERAPYAQDMGRAFGLAARDPAATYGAFGTFQPSHLDQSSVMFKDLSAAREMKAFGIDLATSASHTLTTNVVRGLPYLVLILIIGVTAWYQQKQIQGRNPQMQQINPQQQMLMKIMPYFLPLISFTLPAGVILYFVVSNVFRIGQQGFITRTMYHDAHGRPIATTAVDESSTGEPAEHKGMFAQVKEIMGNSGPPPTKGAKSTKGSGTARAKPASRQSGTKAGSAKAGTSKAGAAKSSASGNASTTKSGSSGNSGRKGTSGKGGSGTGGSDGSVAQADSNGSSKSDAGKPGPKASGPAPSRSAPAPSPNRSKARKKRR